MIIFKFELFGEIYMFVEIFFVIVISFFLIIDQVWVKIDIGDEIQILVFGIVFRKFYKMCKYEFCQYRVDGLFSVFKDVFIVNVIIGEYEVNLDRKIVIILVFFIVFFFNILMVFYFRVMFVFNFFLIIFILFCCIVVVLFFVLLWGFKFGYVFDEYKYMWLIYFVL